MIKKLLLIILVYIFSCSISFAEENGNTVIIDKNYDSGYSVVINDEAKLLSEDEKSQLKTNMFPLTEYGNIVFLSTDYPGKSQHQIAHDYYYGLFQTASGTVLLIDMYERIVYIYSDGDNLKTITKSKAEIITDNIYSYLSERQYYDGSRRAFSEVYTLLEGGKIAEPMRFISNILVSIIIGFSATFIYAFKNSRIASSSSDELMANVKKKALFNSFNVVKTGERKEYSPLVTSTGGYRGHSSGGGHSAGHSASHSAGHSSHSAGHSSHSSGGGGGHRF